MQKPKKPTREALRAKVKTAGVFNVTAEEYEDLLKSAPAQNSPEFLEFIKDTSEFVLETEDWLFVKNIKYHRVDRPCVTSFLKRQKRYWRDYMNGFYFGIRHLGIEDWEHVRRAAVRQKVTGVFYIISFLPDLSKECPDDL